MHVFLFIIYFMSDKNSSDWSVLFRGTKLCPAEGYLLEDVWAVQRRHSFKNHQENIQMLRCLLKKVVTNLLSLKI